MPSGSTRGRSAARAPDFLYRKASRRISTPGSRRGWTSSASATRSTNASTSAPWWTRSSTRDHRMVDANTEGEVYRAAVDMPQTGCFYPPTLITGLSPPPRPDAGGDLRPRPRLRHLPHARRGVQLANNTRYGLAATLWTENLNLALDIAPKLAAGRGLGERHEPVRRRRAVRRGPRKRLRPRRRVGGAAGLSQARHRP
jgi:acyl-CoA reductase-like NAD-dependent aldehyde dehydrogenase